MLLSIKNNIDSEIVKVFFYFIKFEIFSTIISHLQ